MNKITNENHLTALDLFRKYRWRDVVPVYIHLYPESRGTLSELEEAYESFLFTQPIFTKMRIIVEYQRHEFGRKFIDFYGKDGTLVKENFPPVAYSHMQDIWEQEQRFGFYYTDWSEIAGMKVSAETLLEFPEIEIIAHILHEITQRWYSREQALEVLEQIRNIEQGVIEEGTAIKEKQFNGFYQVWSEPNGYYTVYWGSGPVMCERGICINGNKEGVWTLWDRQGKLKKQIRYYCDKEIEQKVAPEWWGNVKDQF